MPRRGLDRAAVVATAADLADRDGLPAVTIAAVAARLGVRAPSLYNHVAGLDALHEAIGARALHTLAADMSRAAAGLARDDALLAVAHAQRAFALAHPGAYAATGRIVGVSDPDFLAGGQAVVDVLLAVLRGYGLSGEAAIHAARATRSAVHGFIAIELAGGFGLPVDLDASFAWTLQALAAGLAATAATAATA